MTGQSSPARPDAIPTRSFPRIVIPLIVIELFATIETSMAFIAIPAFMKEFHADAVAAAWTAAAYLLAGAAVAAISGRLGDIFGRRRVLIVLLCIGLFGSLVSFVAPSLLVLVLGRALQGFTAGALPLGFGLLRQLLPPKRVPLAMSLVVGMVTVSSGFGSLIGGLLIDSGGWRGIFVAASIVGAVAIVTTVVTIPSTPPMVPRPRIDVVGGVLLVPASAGILFGATFLRDHSWTHPLVLGSLLGGVLIFALWVWWERRTPEPMIRLDMFRDRKISLTTVATVAVGAGMLGPSSFLVPLVMQLPAAGPVGLGLAASTVGVLSLLNAFVGYGASAIGGVLAQRSGARLSLMVAAAVMAGSCLLWMATAKSVPATVVVMCLFGVACSMGLAAVPTLVVEVVPEANTGEATGMNRLVLNISVAVGVAVSSMLLTSSTVPGTPLPTMSGLVAALGTSLGLSVIALVLAVLISGKRAAVHPVPDPAGAAETPPSVAH